MPPAQKKMQYVSPAAPIPSHSDPPPLTRLSGSELESPKNRHAWRVMNQEASAFSQNPDAGGTSGTIDVYHERIVTGQSDNTPGVPRGQPSSNEGSASMDGSGDVLTMELRNPSDALQILALSSDPPQECQNINRPRTTDTALRGRSCAAHGAENHTHSIPTAFADYELVLKGVLRPGLVSELLLKYARCYHPYCPIVPSYFLCSSSTGMLQKSDRFLLTAILTIASRDDPSHSLTHRDCWEHTRHLLVDVLLADHWTQTPRTVEGLLLLAEWLPYIQIQGSSETPKNLFSEDRTAWSLVGLAVRHGYLQRLDQGAFPINAHSEAKDLADQSRLIWAYIFMADRQISVRLGQSFWSRGPSLAAKFTAKDFPTLQPHPQNGNEDYASLLEASMELVQILHNAHAVLYSSKERTLAMVYAGFYSRYLDDFRIAAKNWHSKWSELPVCPEVKSTLLIMYEYISLYTNAFSFQAVLTRASQSEQRSSPAHHQRSKQLLSDGIMASPDGRFIFDAISAAMNLLALMNSLDPHRVICYLPSRYYLYGVYAAVLLRKADCAGAFQSPDQREEVTSLARDFISCLEKAPSTESHVCHSYSRMLKQLWSSRERNTGRRQESAARHMRASLDRSQSSMGNNLQQPPSRNNDGDGGGIVSPHTDSLTPSRLFDSLPAGDGAAPFSCIEGYLLGSFMPGVADFSTPGFDDVYRYSGEVQDWGLYQDGVDYGCAV